MTLTRCIRTIALWIAVLLIGSMVVVNAEDKITENDASALRTVPNSITAIKIDRSGDDFALRVQCSELPTYTMYELYDPLRIILDIADASLQESVHLPLDLNEGPISLIQGKVLEDKEPIIVRIEMLMAEHRSYSVEKEENEIVITFPKEATSVLDIEVKQDQTETKVFIRTNGTISEYEKEELASDAQYPDRMYLDIKNVSFVKPIYEKKIGTALKKIRAARQTDGIRIVFDSGLPTLFSYKVLSSTDGLEVVIEEPAAQAFNQSKREAIQDHEADDPGKQQESSEAAETTDEISKSGKSDTAQEESAKNGGSAMEDSFSFAGYNNQRITVDFYKIDLHNVFRLFGEVSGKNMIIAEGVGGNLTLSLNNVPWDFALDIIMNLKDLQKEERFNTIIISPKSKEFKWPERKLDNLAVRTEGAVTTGDSLSVQKKIETPKEIIDARQLLMSGKSAEKKGNYIEALKHYEGAYEKWPENSQLASRMASLYLVHMGMNAKAIHYAKKALKNDNSDRSAALYAAIGLANMKKQKAAQEYFELAVSDGEDGSKPAQEALISYAVFNEGQKNYVAALLLLARHEKLYGDSLDTMVAKARIYDKEGNENKALTEYRAILHSGYDLPPDLSRFIKGRLSAEKN